MQQPSTRRLQNNVCVTGLSQWPVDRSNNFNRTSSMLMSLPVIQPEPVDSERIKVSQMDLLFRRMNAPPQ